MAGLGMAWFKARHGAARQGWAWQGLAWFKARLGVARRGKAWHGKAWFKAWFKEPLG